MPMFMPPEQPMDLFNPQPGQPNPMQPPAGLDGLPPEIRAQILALGGQQDQQGLLAQQMAQAQALAGAPGPRYSTGAAAGIGGLATGIRAAGGVLNQHRAREQAQRLGAQSAQARAAFEQQALGAKTPEERQRLATLGLLSGDAVLGRYAAHEFDDQRHAGDQKFSRETDTLKLGHDSKERGLDRSLEREKMTAAEKAAQAKADADKFGTGDSLRDDLLGNPAVKKAVEAQVALSKVETAAKAKSPAGDMALVFSYMTILDPGSSVREGEYANARNAAGVPERVRNAYNQAMDGVLLSDSQRGDFSTRAKELYSAQAAPARKLYEQFGALAERRGLVPSEVFPDIGFGASAPPAAKPAAMTGPNGARYVLQPDGTYKQE